MVERRHGMAEVARSTRVGSTELLGYALAGFVAGEGSFSVATSSRTHANGEPIRRFVFTVQVEIRDRALLEVLRDFLGVGSVRTRLARKANWQPEAAFDVTSIKAHQDATIPFADRYLLPCAKRDQFEAWRASMTAYVERFDVRWGRGRSTCSIDGCEQLVRGRGLCRRHYYRVTGW